MKREVTRQKKLPSFSMDIGEMEGLWNKLLPLFDSENVWSKIEIKLVSEQFEFKNINELKEYGNLPKKVTSCYIMISDGKKRISIGNMLIWDTEISINASADSEAWCAGAIETAYSYISSYKLWYSWFKSAPTGMFLFILANIPNIYNFYLIATHKELLNIRVFLIWLAILIPFGFLHLFKNKLFPSFILRIRNNEGFIRRYSAELSLIIALLTLVVTMYSIFIN